MALTSIIQILKVNEKRTGNKNGRDWAMQDCECALLSESGELEQVGVLQLPKEMMGDTAPIAVTLVVYKMDRIARSLKDLLSILDRIKASGASIRSLTEPLDTSSPLGIFMIQILGAVGQLERSITRERTVAGQVAAIKRGVVFGRPKLLTPEQEAEVLAMVDSGVSQSATARHFGVTLIVVRRVLDERNGRKNTGLYPVLKDYL